MTSASMDLARDDVTTKDLPFPRLRPAAPGPVPERGWAVVEIRRDGTAGPWTLVTASGPVEATRSVSPAAATRSGPAVLGPGLEIQLGRLQASHGHAREAARSFAKALGSATTRSQRHQGLADLALVEAYLGDLHRSALHDRQAEHALPGVGGPSLQLARAWRHLEQGELTDAGRSVDLVDPTLDPRVEPWFTTIRTLLTAELLMASGRPDRAVAVVGDVPAQVDPGLATWSDCVLSAARADALLAEGEQHRALAAVTPLPSPALVEAAVVAANARTAVGDMRGAHAVLATTVDRIDVAPLHLQIRAWLLEARVAQYRGRDERARLLVDRALRAAAAEGMLNPLRRDWRWVRALADREPSLLHEHREILTAHAELGIETTDTVLRQPAPLQVTSAGPLGARLTEREAQVLELLAEMYSTEEIAAALYVSGNTVKTHLKGIFGKLCVNRRVDAVRRGRQLGLC